MFGQNAFNQHHKPMDAYTAEFPFIIPRTKPRLSQQVDTFIP